MRISNSTQQQQTTINTKQQTQHKAATLLLPKITIDFQEPISHFFYYQNHIICKGKQKILVYNTTNKKLQTIKANRQDFLVKFMPPYLFVLIQAQYLKLYDQNFSNEDKNIIYIKISKMQPRAICRYNKGYFIGGYNKSVLPGNKRTERREIYYIQKINYQDKNTPDYVMKLKNSEQPVSELLVQNPYLIAYCMPSFYLISVFSKEILITFEKETSNFMLIQGRFAMSCMNGIGISLKNTIFTFDVQNFPLYGIEVTQHLYTTQCICLQKTGRIFGGHGNLVFQYNPIKKHSKCWTMYPQNDFVVSISCTANNSLMVLRHSLKGGYFIDVFGLQ